MNSHFTKLRLDTPIFESKFPNRSDSVGINLPWEKVFNPKVVETIMSGKEHSFVDGKVKATYEQKYSLFRVYIGNDYNPVNIYLQDGNIKNIVSMGGNCQSKLNTLVDSGLLTNAVLENNVPAIKAASSSNSSKQTTQIENRSPCPPHQQPSQPSIREEITPSSPNSLGQYVVVAAGPGGTAFSIDSVRTVNANIAKQGTSGASRYHHASSIPMTVIDDAINALSEKAKSDDKLTLFVMAHGEIRDDKFFMNLDGEYKPSTEFFSKIGAKINKPVNVFLTCCHGEGALSDAHCLPNGSTLAILSLKDSPSLGGDINLLYGSLNKASDMSAKSILLLHCTLMQNRIPNAIYIDGKTYQLEKSMKSRLGRPFTETEHNRIHQVLDKISTPQRINEVMRKMETAKTEWSILAVDYGMSLAIAGSLDLPLKYAEK